MGFSKTDPTRPREPMTAEVIGTAADKDLQITLRGKARSYSFKFNYSPSVSMWLEVPRPGMTLTTAPAKPAAGDAAGPDATLGDRIRVTLLGEKKVDKGRYVLTLLAETPIDEGRSTRRAYYYFVSGFPSGSSDIRYLAVRTTPEGRDLSPADDIARNPSVSIDGDQESIELTVGAEVTHIKLDVDSNIWLPK